MSEGHFSIEEAVAFLKTRAPARFSVCQPSLTIAGFKRCVLRAH